MITRFLIPISILGLLSLATAAGKYNPQSMKQSAEEIAFDAEMSRESSSEERMKIAKSYLERYPNDIPLGRYATDVMRRSSADKTEVIDYLQTFANAHPRDIGPQYYYARIADDTLIWEEKARWALAKDSKNFWAWLMWMAAEWHQSNPDLKLVTERVGRAVSLDPSRPEGYFFLGDAFAEQGDWPQAIEAYEAGLVCDPLDNRLRERLEDANDRLKKAEH